MNSQPGDVEDWNLFEKEHIKLERAEIEKATEELRVSVELFNELSNSRPWKHLCELLTNTATAKRLEAMKAVDPTSMARALGYMSAAMDIIELPLARAQQLKDQLEALERQAKQ